MGSHAEDACFQSQTPAIGGGGTRKRDKTAMHYLESIARQPLSFAILAHLCIHSTSICNGVNTATTDA